MYKLNNFKYKYEENCKLFVCNYLMASKINWDKEIFNKIPDYK